MVHAHFEGQSDDPKSQLLRSRFFELWDHLPSLTVLATLPGWGRTTWMRQCTARLTASDTAHRTIAWRGALENLLAQPPHSDSMVTFVDDILTVADDPLWQRILDYTLDYPQQRFVASSIDTPDLPARHDVVILDERNLRFDADELAHFVRIITASGANVDVEPIPPATRGCPMLVDRQLRRITSPDTADYWPLPEKSPEVVLLHALATRFEERDAPDATRLTKALHDASKLRHITADLLTDDPAQQRRLDVQLARLEAMPMFTEGTDNEVSRRSVSWTPAAWRAIRQQETAAQQNASLNWALERNRAAGRTVGQLFYLLRLGRLEAAERLVTRHFRTFLVLTDTHTVEQLLAINPDPKATPTLALLANSMASRRTGPVPGEGPVLQAALSAIQARRPRTPSDLFHHTCLLAQAASLAGQRALAQQYVDEVLALLADLQETHPAQDQSRVHAVGSLFLAYQAAHQTDLHNHALQLAQHMANLSEPDDQFYDLEMVSVVTQQDLAGVRSLSPDGAPPPADFVSHAISFVHLEEGRDAEAVDFLRPVFERRGAAYSRSAIDAQSLLVRALAEPWGLTMQDVHELVELSRNRWNDGQPSSFVLWAASTAYTALGARSEAALLLSSVSQANPDIFLRLARLQHLFLDQRTEEAIELAGGFTSSFPRFQVLANLFFVVALLQADQKVSALARLRSVWREFPSPRLLRFAMRFLTDAAATSLLALAGELPQDLAAALRAAADDPRPFHSEKRPDLTPSELAVLQLLRKGLKNREIAEQRFVTLDTLRSQLKSLYRKLEVTSRVDAVAVAADWRLFETGPHAG